MGEGVKVMVKCQSQVMSWRGFSQSNYTDSESARFGMSFKDTQHTSRNQLHGHQLFSHEISRQHINREAAMHWYGGGSVPGFEQLYDRFFTPNVYGKKLKFPYDDYFFIISV